MRSKQFAAALTGPAALCILLCGCGSAVPAAESSAADGLWLGIEPAAEDEFGKATYSDGLFLSQTVKEPVPDPYADDKKKKRTGTTDDGIKYALYQEHAEITGHTSKFSAEEFEIPAEIEGLPVTKIVSVSVAEDSVLDIDVNGAFYGCYTLTKVKVPEGVREIGNYAFYGCKNLKEIELPESLMAIGDRAFAMCSTLTALQVPSGIDTIGDSAFSLTPWYDDLLYHRDLIIFNGRLYDAGRRCTGDVVIPDYVVSIGDYAFYSCGGLRSVVIPESVQTVGKYAFCDCPGLYAVLFRNPDCEITQKSSTISNKVSASNKDFYKGIIFGEEGSTAEKFAKRFGYGFETTERFYIRQQELREQEAKALQEISTQDEPIDLTPKKPKKEPESSEESSEDEPVDLTPVKADDSEETESSEKASQEDS